MTVEIAKRLFEEINKTTLLSLKNDLIILAVEYSKIRVDWYLANEEAKDELEDFRTAKHNAFIDSCNILSREMIKIGEDASWRKILGNDRIAIGDFACFINLILGIKAR
jgi:hypothetical protein